MTHPDPVLPDPVLEALDDVVAAARANVVTWMGVMERVERVRELRRQGLRYRDMHVDDGVPIVEALSSAQERLNAAAGRFRRATVATLHDEGMTAAEIARIFGVSRQRVSSLLDEGAGQTQPELSAE